MNFLKGADGAALLLFTMIISGLYLFARDWHRKANQLKQIEKKIGSGAFEEITQENN